MSCQAQEYPLKTDYTQVPNNSYLKDLNNELQNFIGTWTGYYSNQKITLYISKENHKFFEGSITKYYQDVLSVKFIITNGNIILQDTQNMSFQPNQIRHSIYSRWAEDNGNTLLLYYGGTNCGVGWGDIYLKKINATQISWEYLPNDIILDSSTCPAGTDINIYLPDKGFDIYETIVNKASAMGLYVLKINRLSNYKIIRLHRDLKHISHLIILWRNLRMPIWGLTSLWIIPALSGRIF